MRCDRCDDAAIIHQGYSGRHLCETHLRRSVEKRVRRRIRADEFLMDDATPETPVTWVLGLSGGKDSVVMTSILHETFAADPRVELIALTIHEGIEDYRDESVTACLELTDRLGIPHEMVSYEEEFGLKMDDVVTHEAATMAPCAYCGVLRRDILEQYADRLGADLLFTGHNLDDETQTAMMNLLSGDVAQMAKHFGASLGPLSERRDTHRFVPRAKPLRDIPEREVALYAHTKELPMHFAECPHSSEAFRGEVQGVVHDIEEDHPGTRHSIMSGYEELARLAAAAHEGAGEEAIGECDRCGAATSRELCRSCDVVTQFSAEATSNHG